jgi:hypothetical protein
MPLPVRRTAPDRRSASHPTLPSEHVGEQICVVGKFADTMVFRRPAFRDQGILGLGGEPPYEFSANLIAGVDLP